MIISLIVENFRSIKEPIELSFEASAITNLQSNVIKSTAYNKEISLLKTISIFGPNASGKSNIIRALDYMKGLVLSSNSYNKGDKLPYEPFRLDEDCINKPSKFEISLLLDNIIYIYGFQCIEELITNEYLYHYPNGRKSIIFERNNENRKTENRVDHYKFTVDRVKQEFYASMTSSNKLYLSVSTNLENPHTEKVFNWFKHKLIIQTTSQQRRWGGYTTHLIDDNLEKNKILNFLKGADFNINDITSNSKKFDYDDEFISNIQKIIQPEALNKFINNEQLVEVKTSKIGKKINGEDMEVTFDLSEESDGTNKFYELAGPFIDMLTNGHCLIYDELDTRLHPNLLVFLVLLFNKSKTNAQLLFTAHNTAILDQKYLRRDQMYFTDRKKDSSTELFSVYDFSEEKISSNINKRYLSGRYKAIPFIDEDLVLEYLMEAING